jgi:DHA2 family multidrug resistance protein
VGWRWAFYINVPVAGFCGYMLPRFFARFETTIRKITIDYVGMLLLAIWVGSFQIVLDIGEDLAWFQSFEVFALSVLSITSFLIFLVWEFTSLFPAVNIRVFLQKDFSIACAVMFFGFGAFFAALVLLPLWLQVGLGYSAKDAGNILAIQGILGVATAPAAAALLKRTDPRLLMSLGLCLIGAGILCRAFFPPIIATGSMMGPQLIIGIGIPLLFVPLMTISLNMVSPSMIAPASSAINFVRTIAAAISTATVVSAWNLSARTTHAILATGLNISGLENGGNGDLSDANPALLEQAVVQQSLTVAFNHLSLIIAAILFLTAMLVWLLPKIDASKPIMAH